MGSARDGGAHDGSRRTYLSNLRSLTATLHASRPTEALVHDLLPQLVAPHIAVEETGDAWT